MRPYIYVQPSQIPAVREVLSLAHAAKCFNDAPADGHGRAEESGWLIGLYHILSAGSQDVWRDAPPTSTNNMTGV